VSSVLPADYGDWESIVSPSGVRGKDPAAPTPRPRPTSVPSFILIHPTVWPQYTNITHGQTDRQTGQCSDSIGQTVLETVTQNDVNFYDKLDSN